VLIELPENPNSHLKFVSLIRTNQNLMQIPFIAFGPAQSETIVNNFKTYGITEYIPRPFDIKTILQTSIKALKNFQKTQQEKQGLNKNQIR
jgi:response regulator RpfG family c-di-GMP phosphodiesterase